MTTADTLTRVIQIRSTPEREAYTINHQLDSLIRDLAEQVRTEAAKAGGVAKPASIISKMLKSVPENRPGLAYPWYDDQGRQITCDGYRAFRLLNPLPLPERPEGIEPMRMIEKAFDAAIRTNHLLLLAIPKPAELRAFITLQKAQKKPLVWDFGPELPAVNAAYLLDLITIIPDALLSAPDTWRDKARFIKALYATGKAGDALLLPVWNDSKKEDYERMLKNSQEETV